MRQQKSLNLFPKYLLPLKFPLFGQLHTFPVSFLGQYSFTPASLLTLGNHSRQQHSFRKPQRAKTYSVSGPGSACAGLCRRPDVSAQSLGRHRVTPASPSSSPAPSSFCACSRLRPPVRHRMASDTQGAPDVSGRSPVRGCAEWSSGLRKGAELNGWAGLARPAERRRRPSGGEHALLTRWR